MSKPSSSSIFRVVQGIIRLTNSAGTSIVETIGDRLKVDGGLSRQHKATTFTATNLGTKYSLALESNLHMLRFRTKPNTKMAYIEYAFSEAEFDSGNTFTLDEGECFRAKNLLFDSKTLYFSVSRDGAILQFEQFYN